MVYDPTAGTGGMLSIAEYRIKSYNRSAKVASYAQGGQRRIVRNVQNRHADKRTGSLILLRHSTDR
jgi:hypothetical protein